MKMTLLATALVSGCANIGCVTTDPGLPDVPACTTSKVSYLCVGMENSKRFGECPGCELDAKRLYSLMKTRLGYEGTVLISDEATKSSVVKQLKNGIEGTPEDGLFLFFYSGHGGQEVLGGKEPDGADRPDEYLCLYDTYMVDDEIWDVVSKCRGRVFMYFDACHSATMYRSVASDLSKSVGTKRSKRVATALALNENAFVESKGFTFKPEKFVRATPLEVTTRSSPRILCWSGCKEEEYSYGGNNGGTLTISVIKSWEDGISYDSLWEKAYQGVNKSQPTQHPVVTSIGNFQTSAEAFK